MTGKIEIKVEGGTVHLGNVVQGAGNCVTTSMGIPTTADGLARLLELTMQEGRRRGESEERIQILEEKVRAIATLAARQDAVASSRGHSLLSELRENYSWLFPILKDAAERFAPWLLNLLK